MRFITSILISLLACFSLAAGQTNRTLERERPAGNQAERRIALVIGNGAYTDSPLRNPVNDATDMATALKALGFEVSLSTNSSQTEMKRAIRSFGEQLRTSGGIGLFYYAGHGVQVKGANYLIPVGATVNTEEEVEYEGIDVGLVLAQMESAKNKLNVVILDACRNNPFARSYRSAEKGLASIDAPSGTLIAYSTAPGSVASDGNGRNGLYTQELLKQMKNSGLSIEEAFKQVRISVRGATQEKQTPWESSSLTGSFYFSGTQGAVSSPKLQNMDSIVDPDSKRTSASLEKQDDRLVPFAKVMNPTFAKDYSDKAIRTRVQFIAPGQTEGWIFGSIPQKVMSGRVAFRVSASDQSGNVETPFGSVPPHVFVDKDKSDLLFELKKGELLILTGYTVVGQRAMPGGTTYTQVIFIATSIERH